MRTFPPLVRESYSDCDRFSFKTKDLSWLINSILKIGDRKKAVEQLKAHIEKGKP